MDLNQFFYEIRQSKITEEFPSKDLYPLYYKAKRREFIVKEGSMLFIPAGWFHFIFSEEPNEECGLNASFHFVYRHQDDWIEGKSGKLLPKLTPSVVPEIKNLPTFIGPEKMMNVTKNPNKIFASNNIFHRFPDMKGYDKKFEKFLNQKKSDEYILLNRLFDIDYLRPEHNTRFINAGISVSFGHITTALHYDYNDVWLCQVKGTKRVLLFPPEDRDLLYLWNSYPLDFIYKLVDKTGFIKWWEVDEE